MRLTELGNAIIAANRAEHRADSEKVRSYWVGYQEALWWVYHQETRSPAMR